MDESWTTSRAPHAKTALGATRARLEFVATVAQFVGTICCASSALVDKVRREAYLIKDTSTYMRIAKSFTLDPEVSNYVDGTKGEQSASDRVNDLLRRAMIQEQYERLEAEAAKFFASANSDRAETRGFQKASLRTFGRE